MKTFYISISGRFVRRSTDLVNAHMLAELAKQLAFKVWPLVCKDLDRAAVDTNDAIHEDFCYSRCLLIPHWEHFDPFGEMVDDGQYV